MPIPYSRSDHIFDRSEVILDRCRERLVGSRRTMERSAECLRSSLRIVRRNRRPTVADEIRSEAAGDLD